MRKVLGVLLSLGLVSIIAGIFAAVFLTHPFSPAITDADLRQARELGIVKQLIIPPVSGWLIVHPGSARSTILFIHGRSSNRMQMFPVARGFFQRGFNVALIDLRHHGNSGGDETYGQKEVPDMRRALNSIRVDHAVDPEHVQLLGFSFGAAMAIGAAASDDECAINAVAADSPYANLRDTGFWYVQLFGRVPRLIAWPSAVIMLTLGAWISDLDLTRLNPSDWATAVRVPVLLIEGENERRVNPDSSSKIYDSLPYQKELWRVPNTGHTEAFYKAPQVYLDRVSAFFATSNRPTCVALRLSYAKAH